MKQIEFSEQNAILGRPKNMTDEECGSLPVYTDGKQCISKWELNEEDKKHINEKGYIWLRVLSGHTQPAVCIEAIDTSFESKKEKNAIKSD